jgi:hypothetical protein
MDKIRDKISDKIKLINSETQKLKDYNEKYKEKLSKYSYTKNQIKFVHK